MADDNQMVMEEESNDDASVEMDVELSQPSQDFCSGSQPSQASRAGSAPSETENDVIDVDKEPPKEKGRKEMQSRSEWWEHFIKIKDANGVVQAAKCKYCSRQVKAESKRDGTSALKRHFAVCKRNPHKFNKDPKQGTIQATDGEGVGTWKFDAEALRKAYTEMIIEDELPFAFGEKPGFRKFMSKACPRFICPSRRTTTRDVVRLYFQEKAKLKKFCKDSCQRVCLTTDCWTSQQQDGYMTVTARFIDDNWEMHKKVINFFLIKGHKGDDIGKNLVRCMAEWGTESVMTVTVDNASNNNNGIGHLRKHLNKTPFSIASGKYLHMRCAAHIVNLIVQDGLKEVDVSIKRIRAVVRYIRNGGTRFDKFKEIVVEERVDNKSFLNEKGKGKGKEKEKENINLLIFVAAVVDPRYKLSLYTNVVIEEIFGQETGQLVWTAIGICMNELFVEYTKLYAPIEVVEEVDDSRGSKGGRGGMLKEVIAKKLKMNNGASSNAKSELDKYLAEDTEDQEGKFDILAWWKSNSCIFPILARLARDVLSIPISTVASESAFSTSGRILDDFRTSLTPFMLEALVCSQDWLRRGTPIDIQESMEELAVLEKELIEEFGGPNIAKGKGKTKASTSARSMTNSTARTSS